MEKYTWQWGLFIAPLLVVLTGTEVRAASIPLEQQPIDLRISSALHEVPWGHALRSDRPDGPPFLLPLAAAIDWPPSVESRPVRSEARPSRTAISFSHAESGHHGKFEFTDYLSPRTTLENETLVLWKSYAEVDDWLFRMQFARPFDFEKPQPLIPISEPTTGLLVLMGIAGRAAWRRIAEHSTRRA